MKLIECKHMALVWECRRAIFINNLYNLFLKPVNTCAEQCTEASGQLAYLYVYGPLYLFVSLSAKLALHSTKSVYCVFHAVALRKPGENKNKDQGTGGLAFLLEPRAG